MSKKYRGIFMAVLGCSLFLAGCGQESKTLGELKEQVSLLDYQIEDENGFLTAEVSVSMPDYSVLMGQCVQEAEKNAKDEEDFENKLYELTVQACSGEYPTVQRSVTVDLTQLDEKKEKGDWTQEDILSAAQDAAFQAEEEEFCLEIIASSYPLDSGESEEAKE